MTTLTPKVAAVLLAAGGSTRMGEPKQLIEIGGRSLVRRASEVALQSRCEALFVVTGTEFDAIRSELTDLDTTVLIAKDWHDGLSRSIRCGVRAIEQSTNPTYDAVLLLLADQPKITPAHLDALITALDNEHSIAATGYAGTLGVPAAFGRQHFTALQSLQGDQGAKPLLHAEPTTTIPFEPAADDIDTPTDLPSP